MANNWLEYWFGWAPLVNDVYGACDVLQKPLEKYSLRRSARERKTLLKKDGQVSWGWSRRAYHDYEIRCVVGCDIAITNPNLFLLNRMGLANPLSVAWAVMPYSFLVDWFANVGDYLNQCTDFAGLTLVSPYTSFIWKDKCRSEDWSGPANKHVLTNTRISESTYFNRGTGINGVTLRVGIPPRLSVTRAASAISLLVQNFVKLQPRSPRVNFNIETN